MSNNDALREALEIYAKREEQEGFFNSVAHKALAANKPEPSVDEQLHDWHSTLEIASKPEPQEQAAEPLAFESAAEARADREHAEKYYRQAERLLTANERTLHEAIAKKDAALDACVEALRIAITQNWHDMLMTGEEQRIAIAAITKAKEARK